MDPSSPSAPPSKFPLGKVIGLTFVLLNEAVAATSLFPFVGFLCARLAHISLKEAGYLSGALVSSFMLAQFFSGAAWGRASDFFGRKPMIQLSLFLSAFVVVAFGLSPTIMWAIAFRFFHGMVNANISAAKTVACELSIGLSSKHESAIISCIPLAWGAGMLIGPAVGGLLYDPVQSPALRSFLRIPEQNNEENIFVAFPAFLPCLAAGLYSLFALLLSILVLPETNKHARGLSCATVYEYFCTSSSSSSSAAAAAALPPSSPVGDAQQKDNTLQQEEESAEAQSAINADEQAADDENENDDDGQELCVIVKNDKNITTTNNDDDDHQNTKNNATDPAEADRKKKKKKLGWRQMWDNRNIRNLVLIYLVQGSWPDFGYNEVLPLWAMLPRDDQTPHALAFSSAQIGVVFILGGVCIVVGNASYAWASELLSAGKSRVYFWRICLVSWAVLCTLLSYVPDIFLFFSSSDNNNNNNNNNTTARAVAIYIVAGLRCIPCAWSFATLFILFNRSITVNFPGQLGVSQGLAQSASALSRAFIPCFVAPLFALTVKVNVPIFFDEHFFFVTSSLSLVWCAWMTTKVVDEGAAAAAQPAAAPTAIIDEGDGDGAVPADDKSNSNTLQVEDER